MRPTESINDFILASGDLLWTWIVLPVVAVLGLYFTLRSGVVQARLFPEMFRTLTDATPCDEDGKPQSVSGFGAFTISAASRVGIGNIAGVGTAIAVGGPGAVFWMWLMAFVGAASSFVESTLGQLFKQRDADGFRGGPAYYMQHGLGARWMGFVFAVILICTFPFAFSSLQPTPSAPPSPPRSVRRPRHARLGHGPDAGRPHRPGDLRRRTPHRPGDAGLGSAPNAGASAAVTHPVKQGLVQSLGIYFDTMIICSITAFTILVSSPDLAGAEAGIGLTQDALVGGLGGWSNALLSLVIFLLAFSSILGNYYYWESNVEFITASRGVLQGYCGLVVLAILAGAVLSSDLIWNTADAVMGLTALVDLVAIGLLSGLVWRLLDDYVAQRRGGRTPSSPATCCRTSRGSSAGRTSGPIPEIKA